MFPTFVPQLGHLGGLQMSNLLIHKEIFVNECAQAEPAKQV